MPSADFCAPVRSPRGSPSPHLRDGTQTSQGKSDRLRRTPAGSTAVALDGYGLRDQLSARPTTLGFLVFWLSFGCFVWAMVGFVAPHRAGPITSRRQAFNLWMMSIVVGLVGVVLMAVSSERAEQAAAAERRREGQAAAAQNRREAAAAEKVAEEIRLAQRTPEEVAADELQAAAARIQRENAAAAARILEERQRLAREGQIIANVFCPEEVEGRLRYGTRWTNGFLEQQFSNHIWVTETEDEKVIRYMGDALEAQNPFGAWQKYIYECVVDVKNERILSVEVALRP